jgi:hypothetical protein
MNGLLKIDGHNNAIVGVVNRIDMVDVLCYSWDTVISNLMDGTVSDMTHEEAVEYFDFNIYGSWMGNDNPVFLYEYDNEDGE